MLGSVKVQEGNMEYIRNVKGIGAFQSFNEAFMEAGPQLVLQLSIVVFRGYASQ